MANDLSRRALAEALGTFSLVAVGCGAIIVNQLTADLGHLGVATALIFVIMAVATDTKAEG
jgi:glycerol uptake facilitator-like aquaporin